MQHFYKSLIVQLESLDVNTIITYKWTGYSFLVNNSISFFILIGKLWLNIEARIKDSYLFVSIANKPSLI